MKHFFYLLALMLVLPMAGRADINTNAVVPIPTNFLANPTIFFANATNYVVCLHTNGTANYFTFTNSDSSRGQALLNAFNIYEVDYANPLPVTNGDVIFLPPVAAGAKWDLTVVTNTFAAALIDMASEQDGYGGCLVGAGMDNTVIYYSSGAGTMFATGNRAAFRDLTILDLSKASLPFADNQLASKQQTNAPILFLNVAIYAAGQDMFVTSTQPTGYYFSGCKVSGTFDIFANGSGLGGTNITLTINGCTFSAAGGAGWARIGTGRMSRQTFVYNSTFSANGGTNGTFCVMGDGGGNITYFHNTRFIAQGNTNVWQVFTASGDTNVIYGDCNVNMMSVTNKGSTIFQIAPQPSVAAYALPFYTK